MLSMNILILQPIYVSVGLTRNLPKKWNQFSKLCLVLKTNNYIRGNIFVIKGKVKLSFS